MPAMNKKIVTHNEKVYNNSESLRVGVRAVQPSSSIPLEALEPIRACGGKITE